MVELRDEVMIQCMDHTQGGIIKGKRTKRPRPLSPSPTPSPSQLTLSIACNSSNTAAEDCSPDDVQVTAADDDHSGVHEYRDATTSYRVSSDELSARSIDVEEDMANCLILLARGQRMKQSLASSSDHTSAPSNGNKVGGSESYQCKTCNRCFPSFQALGGHRASHRKPKAVPADDKKSSLGTISSGDDDHAAQPINPSTTLSLEIPARVVQGGIKSKLHECSICGAEFTSGQALGGHMRRHRTLIASASQAATIDVIGTTSINFEMHEAKKPKNGLHLDLNLPAPEDRESSIQSSKTPKQQVLVFSASSLVDCYY